MPGFRRRRSSFLQGAALAAVLIFILTLFLRAVDSPFATSIRHDSLATLAQVGATILFAYAVEMAWFVKQSRSRGRNSELVVGLMTGIGSCGVLGIYLAIALLGHHRAPLSPLEKFATVWTETSLGVLAGLVGALPYFLYDLVHTLNAEYPDE